jgi:hypothetical protein
MFRKFEWQDLRHDVIVQLPTYRQTCSPFEELWLQMKVHEVLNAPTSRGLSSGRDDKWQV